jgi:hypothetical protein
MKVILDKDLAELYGVETFNLNKAVKRNIDRFPSDFMFQLTQEEFENLIFQFGISRWGGTRAIYPYYVPLTSSAACHGEKIRAKFTEARWEEKE